MTTSFARDTSAAAAPPGAQHESAFPIDAVITWVDGDDPLHRDKLNRHLQALGHKPRAAAPTRFRSIGEIDDCIRSLLKFAPFLRRIHVVTDAQVPPIFKRLHELPEADRDKLVLVDHKDIFPAEVDCLPTFSNRSIETVLHRIPGLAEHYVYLNDDFFLIAPIKPQDWFDRGRPVLRGFWRRQPEQTLRHRLKQSLQRFFPVAPERARAGFVAGQVASAQLAGFDKRFFAAHHTPTPLRKSTLENFYRAHPGLLERNIGFRLRNPAQFSPQFLANHLELAAGTARQQRAYRLLYMKPNEMSRHAIRWTLRLGALSVRKPLFACIQNLESAPEDMQAHVLAWLKSRLK